ncbi:MAG: DUF932 domain-containing protein [Pseudoalteromonas sp.]|uniref:DUF932 domain-containing protein n=1 Tax=Pseudoalteromonas sp. TaxID=53249 RepID=UPI001DED93AD|nr:DUF932 domain-containing protein [Pseudoalteromonas sp.]NRA76782.1 DUF932 domain-containing protein [Pseudoalteromonas sp.]
MTTIYQGTTSINPVEAINRSESQTSKNYQFTSSEEIGKTLESKGFVLDGVSYAKPRKEENKGFQKHIMIFSRPDLIVDGGNKLQLLVTNSHDGKSALKLDAGVYRAVCANGLVAGNDMYSQRVLHKGQEFEKNLRESLEYILSKMESLKGEVQSMQNAKNLDDKVIRDYIMSMAEYRLKDVEELAGINIESVAQVNRYADNKNDVYSIFNTVQENIIRNGIKYAKNVEILDTDGKVIGSEIKACKTREVKAIGKKMDLNKTLWNGAMELVA